MARNTADDWLGQGVAKFRYGRLLYGEQIYKVQNLSTAVVRKVRWYAQAGAIPK